MSVVKELKLLQPNIRHIIVTSETREIIQNITRDYAPWMKENNMNFIINVADVMHGSSTNDKYSTHDDATGIVISMLSTR